MLHIYDFYFKISMLFNKSMKLKIKVEIILRIFI